MRRICFVLMMLIASIGMAAGLGHFFNDLTKPPTATPQPVPSAPKPQAPKPQAPKPPTGK